MQKYGRLVIKNSVLDSLVCSGDSLILDVASPRTHKPKIVNESLNCSKSRLLFSYAEMFKKPLWQTVWTQIRLLL